jgi:hypothetical protein
LATEVVVNGFCLGGKMFSLAGLYGPVFVEQRPGDEAPQRQQGAEKKNPFLEEGDEVRADWHIFDYA